MTVGFFAPEVRRREILLEESPIQIEKMRRSIEEKGYHLAKVSSNLSVIRHKNGDRIVLFTNNLETGETPETPEHFFPENWVKRPFDKVSTREVASVYVKGGTGRSYMVKSISPFRPPLRTIEDTHQGNSTFSEARILLQLQQAGHYPEIPLAIVMRPGYLPTLVTRFIKSAKMADMEQTLKLLTKLKEEGYKPNDLFRRDQQQLMAHFGINPDVNALHTTDGITHPIDVEFYDVPGKAPRGRTRKIRGEKKTEPIKNQEKLARFSGPELDTPLSRYDYQLRRWKPEKEEEQQFQVEWRAFVPGNKKEPDRWMPIEEAPQATWRQFVVYDRFEKKWVLPENAKMRTLNPETVKIETKPAFKMADTRLHRFLQMDGMGRTQVAKSLVQELFKD
ncbi:hypothetical protein HY994_06555 [Candidatus Micrarchaeota archaeon]|nr:hypothetical protein [Candidatus Micrarchaeota archaeon]